MLNVKVRVIYTDGRDQSMIVRPVDAVRLEEKYDIALTDAFRRDKQPKLTHIYFIAWSASDTTIGFDDWLRSVGAIEVGEEADDAAPLVPATSAGSSQNSRSRPASRRKP